MAHDNNSKGDLSEAFFRPVTEGDRQHILEIEAAARDADVKSGGAFMARKREQALQQHERQAQALRHG